MRAYISISYSKRKSIDAEVSTIKETLFNHNIESFVFVDEFKFSSTQEREMMHQAMIAIDRSDLLIAEVSDKAIGIGVEVGYAKAKDKPVIYLRNENAEYSTTVSGISDFQIIYKDDIELKQNLTEALLKLTSDK